MSDHDSIDHLSSTMSHLRRMRFQTPFPRHLQTCKPPKPLLMGVPLFFGLLRAPTVQPGPRIYARAILVVNTIHPDSKFD